MINEVFQTETHTWLDGIARLCPVRLRVLCAGPLLLVRSDDDVGGDEEGVALGGGDHVVGHVPDTSEKE